MKEDYFSNPNPSQPTLSPDPATPLPPARANSAATKRNLMITIGVGVVAAICLVGWICDHSASHSKIRSLANQLDNVQYDLTTAKTDNAKLEAQLEESNRLLQERLNLREKQEAQARVRELNAEAVVLRTKIANVKQRIAEASEFHLFRTRKERTSELDKLNQELNAYADRAVEIEAELARLEASAGL